MLALVVYVVAQTANVPPPPPVDPDRLIIVDDRAVKDQAPAAFLDKALAEIERRKGLKAVRLSKVRDKLDKRENKALNACGDEPGCLAAAAREMGADGIVVVRLSKRSGEEARFLALTRIPALNPQMADDAGTIVGSEKDALPQVVEQIAELFADSELE